MLLKLSLFLTLQIKRTNVIKLLWDNRPKAQNSTGTQEVMTGRTLIPESPYNHFSYLWPTSCPLCWQCLPVHSLCLTAPLSTCVSCPAGWKHLEDKSMLKHRLCLTLLFPSLTSSLRNMCMMGTQNLSFMNEKYKNFMSYSWNQNWIGFVQVQVIFPFDPSQECGSLT